MPATEELARQAKSLLAELGSGNACVEMPAGCGKTEAAVALAEAAAAAGRRTLLLTHTNAGVSAIRRRLARYNVRGPLTVTTIDSFMQQVVRAFPSLGPPVGAEDEDGYWTLLRTASVAISSVGNVQDVLAGSYDLLVVDEYQDCSLDQHTLVLTLAERLPTVVFGDPLQAIFGFKGNTLVPWDDVTARFPPATPFDVSPYRWASANPALGDWLLHEVRPKLLLGDPVDIASVHCIERSPGDDDARRAVPWKYVDSGGSVVFIATSPWMAEKFAKSTKGHFPVLEDLGMRNATEFARQLDAAADGPAAAGAVVAFLLSSNSRLGDALPGGGSTALKRVRTGKPFAPKEAGPRADLQRSINQVLDNPSPAAILGVFERSREISEVTCFAQERVRDATALVGIVARGEKDRYEEAAHVVRDGKRFSQRRESRTTSHPALIKGLEFDACVLLDAQEFTEATSLYVALTRGSARLHVLSSSATIGQAQ